MISIGVLALQGDFAEHERVLDKLSVAVRQVRLPIDLDGLDGLILPGGETTTFRRLLSEYRLIQPLREAADRGMPLWGTCAGLIALAKDLEGSEDPIIGVLDISARRNAFGRQAESFEVDLTVPLLGEPAFPAIFIRAPSITRVGPQVQVLAQLADGAPVAVTQGTIMATAFHPELTHDPRLHAYFLGLVKQARGAAYAAAH
ncbi:MAG: pyridoxal 5'-phosphate synthase glutaminase subunit PdxT [Chloroflexi bacterium]|nr:pyridoxal 5'-phosphate synthase glutaminase subunit PdxT [Chloroflexota bacterium]